MVTIRCRKSRIWEVKEDKCLQQPRQTSGLCDVSYAKCLEMCHPNLKSFLRRRHVGVPFIDTKYDGQKPTETSVFEFPFKLKREVIT